MKVDVKDSENDDGSYVTIESSDGLMIDTKRVGISTHNVDEHSDLDELWIFKRKAFLKAVAKALGVAIYDGLTGDNEPAGYYK